MKGLSTGFERFSRREDCWKVCLFSSYCIEPYAEGNSFYFVGIEAASSEVLADGRLRWTALIAEPIEMMPWFELYKSRSGHE